ncbi:MAG: DUF2141 domain-containing protein [Halioglobus sp.]|nr:DUF2141 domain-containing protein [Halioglobus sp.]
MSLLEVRGACRGLLATLLLTLFLAPGARAGEGGDVVTGAQAAAVDQPPQAAGILVLEVAGLTQAQGNLFVAVYDSGDTWLGDDAVFVTRVDIQGALDGDFVVHEIRLPPGEYAFTVFYDVNGNGDLDTNFIGIPKEPLAVSNNVKPRFGPPKYDKARFRLELEPVIQRIAIQTLD